MDDVFLCELSAVEIFIEIVIFLYIFLFDLQDVLQHLIVIIIDPLKYLYSFGFALFVPFSFHLMMAMQFAPIMIIDRVQI